jgi:hypothetical protein
MEARQFNVLRDYQTVCGWWEAHGWPQLPTNLLPANGFIVEGLCAGFLYKTDSAFAILEFVVGNPSSDKIERGEALKVLIERAIESAREQGALVVFTSTEHPSLIEHYQTRGFVVTDKNMTNLVRRI